MSNEISDELLQRYFDGELSPVERAEVEARLDGDAKLRLEALAELRLLLKTATTAESAHVDFSATFAAIERGATVTPIAPAKTKRRTLVPLSAVGGFLAAAAALVFMLMPVKVTQSNEAEVETLEVQGALATIFKVGGEGDSNDPSKQTTVIWASLDDDEGSALKPDVKPAAPAVEAE